MRTVLLLLALVASAGCTGFPGDTRQLGAWDVPGLAAGANASLPFDARGAAYLLVGYRIGAEDRVLLGLEAPNGTLYAAWSPSPPGPCIVRQPADGRWLLRIAADAWDGNLSAGRFTVRAGSAPPSLIRCADARWPGAGQTVTLAMGNVSVPPGGAVNLTADVPRGFASLAGAVRGDDARNVTLALFGPRGNDSGANATSPEPGTWRLVARSGANLTRPLHITLAIRATGE